MMTQKNNLGAGPPKSFCEGLVKSLVNMTDTTSVVNGTLIMDRPVEVSRASLNGKFFLWSSWAFARWIRCR
jgi:hypothetical protein